MKYTISIDQTRMIQWGLTFSQASVLSILHLAPSWADEHVIKGKCYYWISKSKIMDELPVITDKKNTIQVIINKLKEKGLIDTMLINRHQKCVFRLTDLGKTWGSDSKKDHVNEITGGCDPDHRGGVIPVTGGCDSIHTNNITNNNKTKDHRTKIKKSAPKVAVVSCPDFLNEEDWSHYLTETRKKIKAPNTDRSLSLLVNKITKIEQARAGDGQIALENSIESGWKSFFAPKEKRNGFKTLSERNQEAAAKIVSELQEEQKTAVAQNDAQQSMFDTVNAIECEWESL